MLKKILMGLGALIVVIAGIVLYRTFTYGGAPVGDRVELPDIPAISADTAAEHLSEAIRFKTITLSGGDPRPGQEGPWLALHDWLDATYPAATAAMTKEIVPGTLTLLYTWQGSDPSLQPLLLMAHQDVVPVNIGTEGDWTGAPFKGDIVDGYVYGRGALDDKSNLIGIMEAVEALAASGFQPKRTVILQFGHDEEVLGSGAEKGIALLKSRGVEPVMAIDEGYAVLDPSPLTGAKMGLIGVSEKGYVTLQVTSLGTGGHSSMPPRNSVNVQLGKALVALDENQMPADFSKPPVSDLLRASAGNMPFMQKMALANLWLFGGMVDKSFSASPAGNAMVRTTTAPTMLAGSAKENVLPQRSTAVVNFRVHPNNTVADVVEHVKKVTGDIKGIQVGVPEEGSSEPSPVSPTDGRPYAVLASVAEATGEGAPVAPALVIGATDGRYATAITPRVYRFSPSVLTPADLSGFHGTNERMSVANMGRVSNGFAQIIVAMDQGD
nr:M20 family peptidase [uncultured Hyphomonas sp.]